MTNGDKIRQMSNEELAEILASAENECLCCAYDGSVCNHDCKEGIKAYLDMEVNDD